MVFQNNLIAGASGAGASGFDTELIGNSIWLDGTADFLSKELGAKTRTKAVIGTWIQKTGFTTSDATIFSKKGSAQFAIRMQDQSSKAGKISIFDYDGSANQYDAASTTILLRDIGWYHIMISIDTTADAGSRLKYYINGIDQTSTLTVATDYTLNDNPSITGGSGDPTQWGVGYSGTSQFIPCYLAQSFMLDDDSIQNSDVAVTDILESFSYGDSGSQFGPKADADIATLASSAGGDSFCLDYANSADLGNDISSNNNDFATDGTGSTIAAANQSTNTPSLVFSTYNILDANAAYSSVNDGANTFVVTNVGGAGMRSTIPMTSGKWYWEQRNGGSNECGPAVSAGQGFVNLATNSIIGEGSGSHSAYLRYNNPVRMNASETSVGVTNGATAVIGVAFDADTGKLWFRDSSGFGTSGDPANGTNPHATLATTSAPFFIAVRVGGAISEPFLNAGGNGTFNGNETAGNNADANGHGNFKLGAVPSGFLALCSANVEPQEIQGVDGFATTLATESNIVSSVATSRDGWGTAYVDILKNRSSVEAYIYRFGDDSSNEFIGDGSEDDLSTYQSTSTLSGSDNWAGYSIRIGASYLTAAGSASHSNGAATTVTHSLGTSRYCVLLFERGSSKSVWLHHPDFASGSLLEFFKDEALASSTQITTIGANSFQIGSGAATATYSYLVFADGGIAAMGKYIGNGVVSGPYISMAHSSGFFARRSGGARSFWHNNSKAPGFNENGNYLRFNDPQAEGTGSLKIDMLAGAVKIRDDYADQNTNDETFYWISFGELSGGGKSLPPIYGR